MLYDLLANIKEMGELGKLAKDSYKPKTGLYILLKDEGYEELYIDNKCQQTSELYQKFIDRDFYSNLVEMNKPIDPKKKIHSNNIFTLFFKYNDPEEDKKDPFDLNNSESRKGHIERYYCALEEMYGSEKKDGSSDITKWEQCIDKLNYCKAKMLSNMDLIKDIVKEKEVKAGIYVKAFIDMPLDEYKNAGDMYLLPRLFNKPDYNIMYMKTLLGLSNFNMGTNSKKTYLEHKTTGYEVPFRIAQNEALEAYLMSKWLENQEVGGKKINQGYIPHEAENQYSVMSKIEKNIPSLFIRFDRGTELLISDYDSLPCAIDELENPVDYKNYLHLPDFDAKRLTRLYQLEDMFDELFFNKHLKTNYFSDKKDIKPKEGYFTVAQANLLVMSRDCLHSYFRKFDNPSFIKQIDKMTFKLAVEQINLASLRKLEKTKFAESLNFRFVLLKYYKIGGKENMGEEVCKMFERVKEKALNSSPKQLLQCESDEEFYFVAGQVARYLVGLSKAEKIKYNFISPLLRANDQELIKKEIGRLISKYAHELEVFSGGSRSRFENLQLMLNSYSCKESKVQQDMLLAGFASPSIIYNKEGENTNENEK